MKKTIIFMVLLLLLLTGCNKTQSFDYSIYKQMNETIEFSDSIFQITDCFVSPIDICNNPNEKIITISFEWKNNVKFESTKMILMNFVNNMEYGYYTTDGLDYLKEENPYIRFKVNKDQNEFILKITENQNTQEIYVHLA